MKKLIVSLVIAVALLFSGCNPAAPDYPECPDCICPEYECPDCICPGGSCSCPDCDYNCPDCECEGLPEINSFVADPPVIQQYAPNYRTWLSWVVVGADIISLASDTGYFSFEASATGAKQFNVPSQYIPIGITTFTLTATNLAGSVDKSLTVERIPDKIL